MKPLAGGAIEDADLADTVREQVALVGDMERIASRIAAARVTPRELVQLKNSLFAVELLKAALESTDDDRLHALAAQIDLMTGVRDRIAREIYPDPLNNQIQKGGVIADGVDPERQGLPGTHPAARERDDGHPVAQDQLQQRLRLLYRSAQRP